MKNITTFSKESQTLKIEIVLKVSKFVNVILAIFFIISLVLPLLGLIVSIISGDINFILFAGISLFIALITRSVFKMLMWHSFGKEIFIISKNKVTYQPIIRYFKNAQEEFEYTNLDILFSDRELVNEDRIGTIVFLEDEKKIKSSLKIDESDFEKIKSEFHTL